MSKNEAHLPAISIVVPVYNGATTLKACLEALLSSGEQEAEIIVVDDHSTDDSGRIATAMGVRVIENTGARGPASARNAGVNASSAPLILFVDADVVTAGDTVRKVLRTFEENNNLAAVFGSYDEAPHCSNFLSQYKNLFHHYIHQNSDQNASTFWAGCGAIRKHIFKQLGGFDGGRYRHASIEDVDLGVRMREKGYSIRLEKSLQVKHLKKWTPLKMIRADIYRRAIPWTQLALHKGGLPSDLNFRAAHRISAYLVAVSLAFLMTAAVGSAYLSQTVQLLFLAASAVCVSMILFLNRDLYRFFLKRKGLRFTGGAICWHLFYYFYSGATFVFASIYFRAFGKTHGQLHVRKESVPETS